MKAAVIALLAFVAAATASVDFQMEFSNFMVNHNKVYSHDEFQARYQIFSSNLAYINGYNAANNGVTLAVNAFADLTHEEFKATYLGLSPRPSTAAPAALHVPTAAAPTTQDWRTKGAVTSVKDQGQCGSCWSFSATGSIEGAWFLAGHTLTGLSEQNLMDCSTSQGNQGCNGGLMDQAFTYVINNKGIDTEASYPYTAVDGTSCNFKVANVGATISKFADIPTGDESSLTNAAGTVGPISVAIDASQNSFQFYSSGVYNEPACSSTELDHGVLVVGYGTSNGVDYYIVKNSWNTSWGQKGYIWMSRNVNNQCGIATSASYPIV